MLQQGILIFANFYQLANPFDKAEKEFFAIWQKTDKNGDANFFRFLIVFYDKSYKKNFAKLIKNEVGKFWILEGFLIWFQKLFI